MGYFKTKGFLTTLFLSVTLALGCVATVLVTRMWGQWKPFAEQMVQTGYSDDGGNTENIQATHDTSDTMRTVRAHGEKIGVFDAAGTLEYVIDVYLFTLPPTDQELLAQGICVSSEAELAALIEDYTG